MIGCSALPVRMSWSTVVLHLGAGDGEADTDVAALAADGRAGDPGDRGVDPDDAPLHVEQRPAGVARVDRGVGLDRVDERLVVRVARASPGG